MLIFALLLLWFFNVSKQSLFWLYLLQLKEYRINRLVDHFRTEKGQQILLDPIRATKIGLLFASFLVSPFILYVTAILYAGESVITIKNILDRKIRKPVITSKSISLMGGMLGFQIVIAIIAQFYIQAGLAPVFLVLIDILIPFAVLGLIIVLKPLNGILRRKIINAAKAKRETLKDLLVIGITGSYGKTSTKEFLYTILKDKFNVVKTPEHVNTEIGIANFMLQELKPETQIFICEMGAYVKGEVKDICEITKPKIGVFVGANEQHLSLFGSMENLLRAEGGEELLEALPPKGLAIFNGNNQFAYDLWKRANMPKKIAYTPTLINIINPEKRDVRAENIEIERDHIKFKVFSSQYAKGAQFKVGVLGAHNIENILLAVSVAEELGMALPRIAEECKEIRPLRDTMNLVDANGLHIIDSTYSSNPTAVEAHLNYLKIWDKRKKIVIMPCLIELGPVSKRAHERIGELLAKNADMAIITTRERYEDIIRGASKVISDPTNSIIHLDNPSEILHKVRISTITGDVILLEGRLPAELVKSLKNE